MPSKSKHAASSRKSLKDQSPAKSHSNEPAKAVADKRPPAPAKHGEAPKPVAVAPIAPAGKHAPAPVAPPGKHGPAPLAIAADATREFKEKALENLSGDLNDKIR